MENLRTATPIDSAATAAPRAHWPVLLGVAAVLLLTVALRLPGLHWLLGIGPTADFSFMTDDQRFVDLAKDLRAGMPDGYVYGMTILALVLKWLISPVVPDPNLLQLLRIVTIIHAALTVLLTYLLARSWGLRRGTSMLAAFFLATAPLHIATSNYGTADVTAVAYFYLTMLVAGKYLLQRHQLWFVLAAALTGAAIAIKLFLPLLIPLGLLVLVHRGRDLLTQILAATLLAIGGFELLSFFAYTPWDLANLAATLRTDVVSITSGNPPLTQVLLYGWDAVSALSLPVSLLLGAAVLLGFSRAKAVSVGWWHAHWTRDPRSLITPAVLMFAALLAHVVLLALAGVHAARHLLVLIPVGCIGAAYGLQLLSDRWSRPGFVPVVAIAAVVAYGVGNAVAVERLYWTDIRDAAARWAQQTTDAGRKVTTFSEWTRLRPVLFTRRIEIGDIDPQAYILTCDLEYHRYLRDRDARNLYLTDGGQTRTDFFWNVFDGKGDWRIVEVFRSKGAGLEQRLIDRQILRPIGTFIPKTCLVLARTTTPDVIDPATLPPRVYNSAGW